MISKPEIVRYPLYQTDSGLMKQILRPFNQFMNLPPNEEGVTFLCFYINLYLF